MASVSPEGMYNYVSFVIDGTHHQRIPVENPESMSYSIPIDNQSAFHDVEIYKETEPSCGYVLINSVETEAIEELPIMNNPKIEFIGNSITAGMSADPVFSKCDEGKWFAHSNAYEAFGPLVARKLGCSFMLSAVSGMGMYRNWNSDSPVMKDVYESVVLMANPNTPRLNYEAFHPDVISICIGANDLADGDGVHPRLPFDSTKFIASYMAFVSNLHTHHPQAKFLLLNSPVNSVEKDAMFKTCLSSLKTKLQQELKVDVRVQYFTLLDPNGCDGHPDLAQHKAMANEIELELKEMLGK
jgi:hypothetical protein